MRRSLSLALLSVVVAGCAADVEEDVGETDDALSARAETLWPRANGTVTIPVCWLPSRLSRGRFPVARFGPSGDFLAQRKAWVREIAEQQWNARTPLRFVGWADCGKDRAAFVQLVPIDSLVVPPSCGAGQACVEALGRRVRGKKVYLNLFFGDEFLYAARYRQSVTKATYDPALDLARRADGTIYWIPAACLDELRAPWHTSGVVQLADPRHRRDVNQPAVLAEAREIVKLCTQNNVAHELGHVAGFAHEQYRTDDTRAQRACVAINEQRGIESGDDIENIPAEFKGNLPIGPFDPESIMSYCRSDKSARLSPLDVRMTHVLYGGGRATSRDD